MKKRVISFVLLLAMLATILPSVGVTAATPQIKNVIYLIPDGGGYPLYDFADMVKQSGGFRSGLYPNRTPTDYNPMTMKSYLAGSMTTAPYGGGITDSAAAGTAMATGQKTYNGRIGVDINGKPIANLVEAAQSVGKATGLVATYEWMHATPAAFSAHAMDRNDYYNLYQQIENQGLDVVLGAGYGAVSSYATIQNATDRGYTVIKHKNELADVKPGDKIWGNMGAPSMPYDINLVNSQPTLATMTDAAITALSGDEDGFFLMVEGSKVDTGGHANDALVTTSEYLAFDAAFKVAVDFAAARTDTVVVCAPDHDTGGMILTSTNIIDMKTEIKSVCNGADPATMGWTSTNHTDQDVGVWMYVPEGVSVIDGLNSVLGDTASTRTDYLIDNTALAPYVADLFGVDLAALTEELFVDVTSIGTYSGGKFTFNNGNKYVYANQSVYYKDGQEISMDGKVAVVVNNKVYVPAEMVEDADWEEVTEGYDGFAGSGTANDPYIIADEYDFIEFTANMLAGERYTGKYFKQTENLNLAEYGAYTGIGAGNYFGGIYDGTGHIINVALTTDGDKCLFPYVEGTIMNLGTTGSITCTGSAFTGGITRSIRAGAKLVNCYSTVTLTGYDMGGLSWSNYGTISNCYFAGQMNGSNSEYAIAQTNGNVVTYENCYYVADCGATQSESGIAEISEAVATSTLAETLNNGRQAAAAVAGVDVADITYWTQNAGALPGFVGAAASTVTGVTVTPSTATVNKGDGLQLSATVEGEYGPSQKVLWSLEPESSYAGTYITEDGYLVIDPEETRQTFTVLAKSVQNGSIGGISTITVGNEVVTTPDGSQARPYLIEDEDDFAKFTSDLLAGETYSGKYFKQTADLDMAGYPGYNGMGKPATFAGIYDGNGHVINFVINTATDECLFPYVSGTIMNLGTTGSLTSTSNEYSSGIVRSLRAGGKVVNCYSTATVAGCEVSGIVWSNYGTISNCYFAGSVSGSNLVYPIAQTKDGGTYENCYYVEDCGATQSENGTNQVSEAVATSTLAETLNTGRAAAATLIGVDTSKLVQWVQEEGTMPRFVGLAASLADVTYQNEQVVGNIVFEACLTGCTAYVALYDADNGLAAIQKIQITEGTDAEDFALDHVLSEDVTYTLKLLLWDEVMIPLALPESATVAK